jgi:hypothetical protein
MNIISRISLPRLFIGIFLLAGLYIFPFWLVVLVGLIAVLYIPHYIEFLVLLAAEELLYRGGASIGSVYIYPLFFIALYIVIEFGRAFVRERVLRL